jgi:hypothetical protein
VRIFEVCFSPMIPLKIPPRERLGTFLLDGKTDVNSRLAVGIVVLRVAWLGARVRWYHFDQWEVVYHD